MSKKYLSKNVYEAALERLNFVYDEFSENEIWLSLSGGKDSVVCFHLMKEVALSKGIKSINIAANYTSSSILDMEDSHMVGAPESIYIGSEMIRVFKLDNVVGNFIKPENVVFLKLDVQGYELEVLEGAQKTLPFIKGLQIEISIEPLYKNQTIFKEMLIHIEQLGYELWDIQPCFRDKLTGKLLQFDGIFVRNF